MFKIAHSWFGGSRVPSREKRPRRPPAAVRSLSARFKSTRDVCLALSSLTGILCGLAPALLEVALAVVLLDGAALMAQSMVRLLSVDAGFRTDHILSTKSSR
jgi:hypothetical protein